jgi:hypothetical protein
VARDALEHDVGAAGVAVLRAARGAQLDRPQDGHGVERELPGDDLGQRLHPGLGNATASHVPMVAMPVDLEFQPCAWAPMTAASTPPARPSKTCPYWSTSRL